MDMLPFVRFISYVCMSCVCPQYVQTTSSKNFIKECPCYAMLRTLTFKMNNQLMKKYITRPHNYWDIQNIMCHCNMERNEKRKINFPIPSHCYVTDYHYTHRNFSLTSNVEYVEECLPNFLPNWDCRKTRYQCLNKYQVAISDTSYENSPLECLA